LLFTQGLPWALLAALVAPAKWIAGVYLLAYLILRFAMAWTVGIWGVGDEVLRRKIWLVPLRDAVHFAIWLASFGSNHVRWGDGEFAIRQGRMVPLAGVESTAASPAEDAPRS
jgi:ceramide glucosyltransferase